jgi:hypothetical protein
VAQAARELLAGRVIVCDAIVVTNVHGVLYSFWWRNHKQNKQSENKWCVFDRSVLCVGSTSSILREISRRCPTNSQTKDVLLVLTENVLLLLK